MLLYSAMTAIAPASPAQKVSGETHAEVAVGLTILSYGLTYVWLRSRLT